MTTTPCSWSGIDCGNGHVTRLYLQYNQLSGSLPVELANLSELEVITLNNNQLCGDVPAELMNLTELWWITLNHNHLTPDPAIITWLNDTGPWDGSTQTDCPQIDCTTVTEIPEAECEALLDLYDSTDGDNWLDNTGWNVTNTPCNWNGITLCENGHIKRINLSNNNLSGTFPAELANLSQLQYIRLWGNQLSGAIPTQLGNLMDLEVLDLDDNQLTGSIPMQLGNLSKLRFLTLLDNQLTGSIPTEIGNLNNLDTLWLEGNELCGNIPPSLKNLTKVSDLRLDHNHLTDPNDHDLTAWLNSLNPTWATTQTPCSSACGAVTEIPVTECEALTAIYDNTNGNSWENNTGWKVTNTPCSWYGIECGNGHVTRLYLHHNQLSGSIPANIQYLSELGVLALNNNQLCGNVPEQLMNLSKLWWMSLNYNHLTTPGSTLINWINERGPGWDDGTQTSCP